jgi:hypothetical protein
VAACVRDIMAERSSWAGRAVDLLRVGADRSRADIAVGGAGWPNNPRALAGRLRRVQTFLRARGIDIAFSREGRAGNRIIRMHASLEATVCTVGTVSEKHSPLGLSDGVGAASHRVASGSGR